MSGSSAFANIVPNGSGTELTINQSGATYTATEDGWLCLGKRTNSTNYQYIQIGGLSMYAINGHSQASQAECWVMAPIQAGKTAAINYTAGGAWTYKKFIPALGTRNTRTIIKF